MTHTYHHRFQNGITATATVNTDPPDIGFEWSEQPGLDVFPEYFAWRATLLADFTALTGQRVLVVDLAL